MEQELVAWMPTDHDLLKWDLETAQWLFAIRVPKGRVLDITTFRSVWPWEIQELIDEIEYPQGSADHLMSKLESEGLLPPWLTYREPKTAALDLLDPEINTRINDLLGAWLLTDNLPNKPVLVNNKEAESIIKGRYISDWIDSLRYP